MIDQEYSVTISGSYCRTPEVKKQLNQIGEYESGIFRVSHNAKCATEQASGEIKTLPNQQT